MECSHQPCLGPSLLPPTLPRKHTTFLPSYLYTVGLRRVLENLGRPLSHEPVPHCCPQTHSVWFLALSACVRLLRWAWVSALAWMLPLRSQASEYFVGASHFREEADKTWFMASPCYNLAHLPDAILTVPWREHGIASPLSSASRGCFESHKARSLPELGEPSLFCPQGEVGIWFPPVWTEPSLLP